ncbi:hypothetical protein EYF80_062724 [Liparis tanakae]|uniref:Uncharacterized protein n=1 Tax=Liparis tanakae TaxID=230148 RepID=A0A4Z2EEI1_9TELE|nr:hypothetical protein EYF80_062724 [Liparis tanakae]
MVGRSTLNYTDRQTLLSGGLGFLFVLQIWIFTPENPGETALVSTDLSMLMAHRLKMEAVHSSTSMAIRPSHTVEPSVHTPPRN